MIVQPNARSSVEEQEGETPDAGMSPNLGASMNFSGQSLAHTSQSKFQCGNPHKKIAGTSFHLLVRQKAVALEHILVSKWPPCQILVRHKK